MDENGRRYKEPTSVEDIDPAISFYRQDMGDGKFKFGTMLSGTYDQRQKSWATWFHDPVSGMQQHTTRYNDLGRWEPVPLYTAAQVDARLESLTSIIKDLESRLKALEETPPPAPVVERWARMEKAKAVEVQDRVVEVAPNVAHALRSSEYVCACGRSCASAFGLQAHRRYCPVVHAE